jgi:hypothetical protein
MGIKPKTMPDRIGSIKVFLLWENGGKMGFAQKQAALNTGLKHRG